MPPSQRTDYPLVASAEAAPDVSARHLADKWIPACAGMTSGLLTAFCLLFALASPSAAQIVGPNAANDQPLNIQADSGIEWQQDQKLYIARGNAVATRGASEVRADTLIAYYRETKGAKPNSETNTGGNTEIYRVVAEGHVTMKRDA